MYSSSLPCLRKFQQKEETFFCLILSVSPYNAYIETWNMNILILKDLAKLFWAFSFNIWRVTDSIVNFLRELFELHDILGRSY